ncbi:MAG TPA: ATP-binding cassette domain-containing protein [Prolixibacteraceae bacterium]|nr:ATP-binding cassette domain-containing protein [Prolixibacteraceae bacterium]HPS13646.1 ATP-binding cassette domain-containing protein [Prolixibacteraceae bacterium]
MSIKVENIVKRYGQQLALDQVNFTIDSGEITGFLGPNGAGKSTLMKIVTGFLSPDSGNVQVEGMDVDVTRTAFRAKIGYLPEHNPLYPEMYIREYLRMVAGFYQLNDPKGCVERVIEMTGLAYESTKKIGALSKGYKQRVGLAQALIHDPRVLILDEPTSGLDPNQLDEIRALIKTISHEKTVLLSTHIMQEVDALCSRIIIIKEGKLVADGSNSEIKKLSKGHGQKVLFSTLENIHAEALLALPFVDEVSVVSANNFMVTSEVEKEIRPALFHAAVQNRWTILTMVEESNSFEEIFRELTR